MNICKLNTSEPAKENFYTLQFVYETQKAILDCTHIDSSHRLYYAVSGSCKLKTTYLDTDVKAGDMFFTFSASDYTLTPSEDFSCIYIGFLGLRTTVLLDRLSITKQSCVFHSCNEIEPMWRDCLEKADGENTELLTEAALLYAFAVIEGRSQASNVKHYRNASLAEIKKQIEKEYLSPEFTVRRLAEGFSYNPKYLSKLFRQEFGLSVTRYVTLLRIQKAAQLLKSNRFSIGEIAEFCGFSDQFYFSKVFKRHTGLTPKEYVQTLSER